MDETIGGDNTYKLAFDFHDDVDARFCIRSITSTANPDTVTEVFTVDNGNVSCTGSTTTSRIRTHNNTFPDLTAVNNAILHSVSLCNIAYYAVTYFNMIS